MAVAADGDFCGTIGGGIMEHKLVEMANRSYRRMTDLFYSCASIMTKTIPLTSRA